MTVNAPLPRLLCMWCSWHVDSSEDILLPMLSAAGANDVANSFGTSVGSKTLKLWSAVVIAGVFEFLGALLLGGQVTRTIAGGIARVTTFRRFPAQFMFGGCPPTFDFPVQHLLSCS